MSNFTGFIISKGDKRLEERLSVHPFINRLKSGKQMAVMTAVIIILYWIFESVVDLLFFPHASLGHGIYGCTSFLCPGVPIFPKRAGS